MFRAFTLFIVIILNSNAAAEESELWLGKVISAQARNTTNELGEPEITIEWLSERFTSIDNLSYEQIISSQNSILVKPLNTYFVTTLRTQEMSKESVIELVKDTYNNHVSVSISTVSHTGFMSGKEAVYLSSVGPGVISDEITLQIQ